MWVFFILKVRRTSKISSKLRERKSSVFTNAIQKADHTTFRALEVFLDLPQKISGGNKGVFFPHNTCPPSLIFSNISKRLGRKRPKTVCLYVKKPEWAPLGRAGMNGHGGFNADSSQVEWLFL
jgi:hypothetical protein